MKNNLKGSPRRDQFKLLHKKLPGYMYALDIDLALITKKPSPCILAFVDAKAKGELLTFTEVIAYNHFLALSLPVYIVETQSAGNTISCEHCSSKQIAFEAPYHIYKYTGGDPFPDPPVYTLDRLFVANNLEDYQKWEDAARKGLMRTITERGHWLSEYGKNVKSPERVA